VQASVLTLLWALRVKWGAWINLSGTAGISAERFPYSRAQHSFMNNSVTFCRIKEQVKCLRQHLVHKAARQDERSG